MRRSIGNGAAGEGADPPEAELAPQRQNPSRKTDDQGWLEELEQRLAAEAEATPSAQERIDKAISAIRSFHDPQSYAADGALAPDADWSERTDDSDERAAPPTAPLFDHDDATPADLPPSLDPQVMPPPPADGRRGLLGPALTRSALMVGLAALVAFGIAMLPSLQHDGRPAKRDGSDAAAPRERLTSEQAIDRRPPARLVVEDERAFANDPILLDVSVAPATGYGSLSLSGLARGTRLSAGTPLSEAAWELPLREVGGVYVYAPQNFVGVMDAMIDLLSPSRAIVDRRPMRLEWVAKSAALRPPIKEETGGGFADAAANKPAIKPMDPQLAAALMERGRALLRNGDVALAQLAFRRLADAGHADAALALAATYDPRYLAEHKFVGITGDAAKARAWYQRASALGSTEADRILRRLDNE